MRIDMELWARINTLLREMGEPEASCGEIKMVAGDSAESAARRIAKVRQPTPCTEIGF